MYNCHCRISTIVTGLPRWLSGKESASHTGDAGEVTQEKQFWCLGQEDPLEEEMATHSSILAWEILWTAKSGGLQSIESQSRTQLSDWAHIYALLWHTSSTKDMGILQQMEIKLPQNRTSLVVQWLGICLPMQGTWLWSLIWEDFTYHGATNPMRHNFWAHAPRVRAPQQKKHHSEKSVHHN